MNLDAETEQRLLKQLHDGDSSQREDAVKQFISAGTDSLPTLLGKVDYRGRLIRCYVVDALVGIAKQDTTPRTLRSLISAAYDRDIYNRVAAIMALGELGSEYGVIPLSNIVKNHSVPSYVRYQAADSLLKIGSFKSVPSLLKALCERNDDLRHKAVEAILSISKSSQGKTNIAEKIAELTIEELVLAVGKNDRFAASNLSGLLVQLGEAALEPLSHSIDGLATDVCFWVAITLGEIKNPKSVNVLRRILETNQPLLMNPVLDALARINTSESFDPIAGCIDGYHRHDVEDIAAVKLLENPEKGIPSAINMLFQLGTSRNEKPTALISLLAQMGKASVPKITEALDLRLKDPEKMSIFTTNYLLVALGHIQDPSTANLFAKFALEDNSIPIRVTSIRCLTRLGGPLAEKVAGISLNDSHPLVCAEAAQAFATLKSSFAVPRLLELLEFNPNSNVIISVLRALREIGNPVCIRLVLPKITNNDSSIRTEAELTLSRFSEDDVARQILTYFANDRISDELLAHLKNFNQAVVVNQIHDMILNRQMQKNDGDIILARLGTLSLDTGTVSVSERPEDVQDVIRAFPRADQLPPTPAAFTVSGSEFAAVKNVKTMKAPLHFN